MDAVRDVTWSPDGLTIVSVSQDKTVRVWSVSVPEDSDSESGQLPTASFVATFAAHADTVRCVNVRACVCTCMSAYVCMYDVCMYVRLRHMRVL